VVNDVPLSVEPTQITFSPDAVDLLQRSPDDIIVSTQSGGYLRRVMAIDTAPDGSIVVMTKLASLNQALTRASVQTAGIHARRRRFDTPSTVTGPSFDGLSLKFGNTKIVDNGADFNVSLTTAAFDFDAGLDFDLQIDSGGLEHLRLVANGSLAAIVGIQASASGSLGLVQEDSPLLLLGSSPASRFEFFAGPVPIVVVATLKVYAVASASFNGALSVDDLISASSSVSAGIDCNASGCTAVGDQQFSLTPDPINVTAMGTSKVTVGLVGKLSFTFYDVAGPYVSVQPYVGAVTTDNGSGLETNGIFGVKAQAGGEIKIFDYAVAGFQGTLFDWSTPINPVSTSSPQSACVGQVGQSPVGTTSCDQLGLSANADGLSSCVQGGGGESCLQNDPNCASGAGNDSCDLDLLFDCLCGGGGSDCVGLACTPASSQASCFAQIGQNSVGSLVCDHQALLGESVNLDQCIQSGAGQSCMLGLAACTPGAGTDICDMGSIFECMCNLGGPICVEQACVPADDAGSSFDDADAPGDDGGSADAGAADDASSNPSGPSCAEQAADESVGDMICDSTGLRLDYLDLYDCIAAGGGETCLLNDVNCYTGTDTCDIDAVFTCLCGGGNASCIADNCTSEF
jgi:hypothetical protein